ncbi:MAG: helicase C-terminal domain-containing protein [Ktedonobacteraceae bacterium]
MAKKSAVRVALDLETTGLHAEQDAILEIAAIKFQGTEVIDTFETFVAPGRSIPYRVQRLTGIKSEHLIGAPPFAAVANKLQHFLSDLPIVGHSIPFDVGFLRMRGLARANPLVDTFELATVLLPSLVSYNLGQVAEALGVQVPQDRHRAMVDTVLAMEVFVALHKRLQSVDLDLLNDLAHLDAPRSWPLLQFFRQELRERQEHEGVYGKLARGSVGERFAAQLGMDPHVLSFAVTQRQETDQVTPQSPADIAISSPSSPVFSERLPTLPASRDEQATETGATSVEYHAARVAVHDALTQLHPLLLEVAVGGHDYIPALFPALEWLAEESAESADSRRLVIACSHQQGARYLIDTILPRLQAMLKCQLPVAYLAEHGGYLCTHRWFGAAMRRTSGELTAEQARGLAKLRLWTHQTLTGERGELTLLQQEMSAWERISSGFEQIPSVDTRFGTSYQRCTYRRKGYCFVSLAEERVNAARIVVTTHAGLFDDLSRPHSLLSGIKHRLILDSDLLEEENARWGSAEFDQTRLLRLLNTIGTELPDGRYQGLLALAAPSLRENGPGGLSTTPTSAKSELDPRMLRWFQALRQGRVAVEKLFASFRNLLEEFMQQGTGGGGREKGRGRERTDQPLRLNGTIRHLSIWTETQQTWQQAAQKLQAVVDLANEAEKIILTAQRGRNRLDVGSGEDSSVASELVAAARQLSELKSLAHRALSLGESESVYWLRTPPSPPPSAQNTTASQRDTSSLPAPVEQAPILYSQIVQTAAFLKRHLLKEQNATIFAGTALSVDSSFSFIRNRFGLENDGCAAISVAAEHHEQTLLYLPDDVSEPNTPQYQRHLDETLIQLATALDGQVVALFTSHASLRSTYAAIKPLLEARGILVLGQGVDGSPRQLWQIFQTQERIIILGTGSFWDGVDDIARTPTCLFIARLPMPVLNDPPIAARVEQYSDQLHQMTVPIASLRLKRVLNRLTWSDRKRNCVVLFDRRVTSKEYGAMILHSLPRCSQRQGAGSHMAETIMDWLTGTGSWENDNA